MSFFVICRDDEVRGIKGDYILATRRTFDTRLEALVYEASISPDREPIVVEAPHGMVYEGYARSAEAVWNAGAASLRFDMLGLAGFAESAWIDAPWSGLPLPMREAISRAHDEAIS